jgi:hypothetical protein
MPEALSDLTFTEPPLGIITLPDIASKAPPIGTGACLTMYLSLEPSLRTISTRIEVVPVLDTRQPIITCLLDVVVLTVVSVAFANEAVVELKLFAIIVYPYLSKCYCKRD